MSRLLHNLLWRQTLDIRVILRARRPAIRFSTLLDIPDLHLTIILTLVLLQPVDLVLAIAGRSAVELAELLAAFVPSGLAESETLVERAEGGNEGEADSDAPNWRRKTFSRVRDSDQGNERKGSAPPSTLLIFPSTSMVCLYINNRMITTSDPYTLYVS